jgi:hypothetical protein
LVKRNKLSAPNIRELAYICWGTLLVGFVLPLCIVQFGNHRTPNADFVHFYSLGKILNEHSARDLYDLELQYRTSVEVHPGIGFAPMPHPPFVGMGFRTLACFPYWIAYLLWITITVALYARGLAIISERFLQIDRYQRWLLFALAFAYFPFAGYTAINGQLSAVAFFGMAVAMVEDDRDRQFRSGLALTICLYKPTLFVLLGPMLIISRRFRTTAGLATGAAMLGLITTAIEGPAIWPGFVKALTYFGHAALGRSTFLHLAMYVDLKSFSTLMTGFWWPSLIILLVGSCSAAFFLFQFWWKTPKRGRRFNSLCWAATLTWTLLLNAYVPIYDTILIVLSLIATAGALKHLPRGPLHRWFTICIVCILASSWVAVPLAEKTRVQLLTLVISAFGVLQIVAAVRIASLTGSLDPQQNAEKDPSDELVAV